MVNSNCSDKIVVATACDVNYLLPMTVTLFSLVEKLEPGSCVQIYILCLGLQSWHKTKVSEVVKCKSDSVDLVFVDCEYSILSALPSRGYVSVAAYLRIFLPSLVPEEYEKIIYIDSDMLILRDIRSLWDIDCGKNLVIAGRDPWISTVSSRGALYNWKDLGIDPNRPYFNSGVLVINLKEWRRRNITLALLEYISEHKNHMVHADQDAFNAVCHGSWQILDMKWNAILLSLSEVRDWEPSELQASILQNFDELLKNPSICHFAARWKPWIPGYRPPLQREWFLTVKRSGWYSPLQYHSWRLSWLGKHYYRAVSRKIFDKELPLDAYIADPRRADLQSTFVVKAKEFVSSVIHRLNPPVSIHDTTVPQVSSVD